MKVGKISRINVYFTDMDDEAGNPQMFEYTYSEDQDMPSQKELFYTDGMFVFIWNVNNTAHDIYPSHRIHSVGIVYDEDVRPNNRILFQAPPVEVTNEPA